MIKIPLSEIKDKKKIKINDNEILILKIDNNFYAIENKCPHAGCRLSYYGKILSEKRIMCTCHGAIFSLEDGKILDGPTNKSLKVYKIKIANEELLIEFKP